MKGREVDYHSVANCFTLFLCDVDRNSGSAIRESEKKISPANIWSLLIRLLSYVSGFFLFITPRYVLPQESFPRLYGNPGEAFCRVVFSTYFVFCFGKASNATVMCLAIDRWYSIIKPIKYKIAFGRRRLLGYIALIWATSAVTECLGLFITKPLENGRCAWAKPPYSDSAHKVFILVHVIVTFYIPSVVTWGSFAHILSNLSRNKLNRQNNNVRTKKRLVRMCALAAFFLTICWFPTETFFVLKKFDVLTLPDVWYWIFNLLGMFNSCINPWLYCLSNRHYRREFVSIVPFVQTWDVRRVSWQPSNANLKTDVNGLDTSLEIENLGMSQKDVAI